MTEKKVKNDWVMVDKKRALFWVSVKEYLSYLPDSHAAAHAACGVDSMKDFGGSLDSAIALVMEYAANGPQRARSALIVREPEHAEARVIAFCDLYAPDGTRIALTAREGVTHDELVRVALSLTDAAETLINVFSFSAAPQKYTNNKQLVSRPPVSIRFTPPPVPSNAPPAQSPALPPPPAGHSHPVAPALPPAPPAENGQAQGGIIQAEIIKITAPKGKPVVEFWRPNRKYYEIRWQLGGERLLAIAPAMYVAGWRETHFGAEAVGQEYQLPVSVHWTPSKPDGKYKDITLVTLR